MRIINKGRGQYKSTQLLYVSELTRYRIICSNRKQVEYLKYQAEELGLNIPEPMSYGVYKSEMGKGMHETKILIDNVDQILDKILFEYFNKDVVAVTMSVPMKE